MRDASVEPIERLTHARRFTGFDDKLIALSARGMPVRDIQALLLEQHATQVSPEFISSMWIEHTEGATFWMKVFNDLKTRGIEDILMAVTEGLTKT